MTFFMARTALKLPLKTKVNIDREISPGRNTNHQENRLASYLSNKETQHFFQNIHHLLVFK
jgi:hypothetical protein